MLSGVFEPVIPAINRLQTYALDPMATWMVLVYFFPHDTKVLSGTRRPHWSLFTITLRHITFGRIPLDEWSVHHRYLYLTTHNSLNRQTSIPRRDSNLQSYMGTATEPGHRSRSDWQRFAPYKTIFLNTLSAIY